MTISNFTPLIQLSATISIAFVAVEYAKSYTKTVCDRIFGFKDHIVSKIEECNKILPDQQTIDNLKPKQIGGGNTNKKIEELKLRKESINKELKDVKEQELINIANDCQTTGLSAMSLYIFMFDVLLLIICGFDTHQDFFITFSCFLCFITIIYMVAGWICEWHQTKYKVLCFSSLMHSTICMSITIVVSIVLWYVFKPITNEIWLYVWKWEFIVSLLLTFIHYIVFALLINHNGKNTINEFDKKVEKLKIECQSILKEVDRLRSVDSLESELISGVTQNG